MTTFVPLGYELLENVRERLGITDAGAALAGGQLKAFRLNSWGELHEIDRATWLIRDAELMLLTGRTIGRVNSMTGTRHSGDQILVKMPEEGTMPPPRTKASPAKDRGGAPGRTSDWHEMWIEVCRIIHEEGIPTDHLQLRKRMQDWFAERGLEPPAEQTLTPLFKKLIRTLAEP